ncbi:hypothetical protein B0H17DRAFT_214218 [Mycena rosella]|uniref:Uncharacterized protein n=1 Tax=Mycena rosella TaxID=1033263 RepID=A0AAD7GPC5_MYCRO|nr:hypothetical protein B0H17DRAFT_214218 [Mycena rosella]
MNLRATANDVGRVVSKIIDGLTLPNLAELKLCSEEYFGLPVPWPHVQCLALSTRSAFQSHLRSLQLHHCVITEAELLECLSALPSLERLAISDHRPFTDGGPDQLLVTNTLLASLTLAPDNPSPVPRLRFFECISLLRFDDRAYLDFLLSRLRGPDADAGPFENRMLWLPGHHRELNSSVVARIVDLRSRKELLFSFAELEL